MAWLAAPTGTPFRAVGPRGFAMSVESSADAVSVDVGVGDVERLTVPLSRLQLASGALVWRPRLLDAGGKLVSSGSSSQGSRYRFASRVGHSWVAMPYVTSVREMPWRLEARGVIVRPSRRR